MVQPLRVDSHAYSEILRLVAQRDGFAFGTRNAQHHITLDYELILPSTDLDSVFGSATHRSSASSHPILSIYGLKQILFRLLEIQLSATFMGFTLRLGWGPRLDGDPGGEKMSFR